VALTPFASVDRSALRWLRTNERPMRFVLKAGDASIVELNWSASAGSLATADSAATSWSLKRGGFLSPHVSVRVAGNPATIARVSAHLNHHQIDLAGGASYRLHRAGFLVPAWTVSRSNGEELLHIEPVREGRKLEGGAALASPAGVASPDLLLLAVASWYFIVLAWFEDEAIVPLEGRDEPSGPAPDVSGGSRSA
jgi:hypothetical protein